MMGFAWEAADRLTAEVHFELPKDGSSKEPVKVYDITGQVQPSCEWVSMCDAVEFSGVLRKY